jgi:hypothetical protein
MGMERRDLFFIIVLVVQGLPVCFQFLNERLGQDHFCDWIKFDGEGKFLHSVHYPLEISLWDDELLF